jgi:hypothetical protein
VRPAATAIDPDRIIGEDPILSIVISFLGKEQVPLFGCAHQVLQNGHGGSGIPLFGRRPSLRPGHAFVERRAQARPRLAERLSPQTARP